MEEFINLTFSGRRESVQLEHPILQFLLLVLTFLLELVKLEQSDKMALSLSNVFLLSPCAVEAGISHEIGPASSPL